MKNDDLISRSALKKDLLDRSFFPAIVKAALENAPAVDAASRSVFEQIKWERDCAMQQLKDHGIPFGGIAPAADAREKMIELLGDYFDIGESTPEDIADKLLSNGVTFAKDTDVSSKWISVEDRLPHAEYGESDNVLTINRVGICKVLYFDGGCWCYPTGEPVYFGNPRWRITHWMPLPEPPVGNPSVSLEADSSLCTREPLDADI